jgi:hypothetical protein
MKPIPPKSINLNVPMVAAFKKVVGNPTDSGDPAGYWYPIDVAGLCPANVRAVRPESFGRVLRALTFGNDRQSEVMVVAGNSLWDGRLLSAGEPSEVGAAFCSLPVS